MSADRVDLDVLSAESRRRLAAVIAAAGPGAGERPVAACPGWTVRDVVAHLVGIVEDAAAGRVGGIPSDEQTEEQVTRHRDRDGTDVLAEWSERSCPFEAAIARRLLVGPAQAVRPSTPRRSPSRSDGRRPTCEDPRRHAVERAGGI